MDEKMKIQELKIALQVFVEWGFWIIVYGIVTIAMLAMICVATYMIKKHIAKFQIDK